MFAACSLMVPLQCGDSLLHQLVDEVKAVVGSEAASLFLLDAAQQELCSTINSTGGQLRIPASAGVAGYVASTGEAVLIPDAYGDSRFNKSVDLETGMRTRNILCAPVRASCGSVLGVAQLVNKVACCAISSVSGSDGEDLAASLGGRGCLPSASDTSFTHQDLAILESMASQAAEALKPAALRAPKGAQSLIDDALATWEADTLVLADASAGRPLSSLCVAAFERLGLPECFAMDRQKLERFLVEVEDGYAPSGHPEITYHNAAHAASVVAFTHALLVHGGVVEAMTHANGDSQLEVLALMLAAVVHDYEHKGLTNPFLVKTEDERASRHPNHVNESHHVMAALELLRKPELNFLEALDCEQQSKLEALMIDLVLATDAADGAKVLADFKNGLGTAPRFEPGTSMRSLALQIVLKCADLGHLALPWDKHLQWVGRLEQEFFVQGDREKELGFPEISFLMDRSKPGVSQSQVGFFEFVVLPLFESLVHAFPEAAPMLQAVMRNQDMWNAREAAEEAVRRRATIG